MEAASLLLLSPAPAFYMLCMHDDFLVPATHALSHAHSSPKVCNALYWISGVPELVPRMIKGNVAAGDRVYLLFLLG